MAVLRMNAAEFAAYHRRLAQKFRPTVLRGIRAGAARCIQYLVERTRAAPPANPGGIGSGGAVNTGAFIREWRSMAIPDGAVLTNRKPYGPIVEWGRRPGAKMPPKAAIVEWIKRRLLTKPPKRKLNKKSKPRTTADADRSKADTRRREQAERHFLGGQKQGPRRMSKSVAKARMVDNQAERLSWPIRRAIARRGLIGRKILTGEDAKRRIMQIVEKEVIHELEREQAKK